MIFLPDYAFCVMRSIMTSVCSMVQPSFGQNLLPLLPCRMPPCCIGKPNSSSKGRYCVVGIDFRRIFARNRAVQHVVQSMQNHCCLLMRKLARQLKRAILAAGDDAERCDICIGIQPHSTSADSITIRFFMLPIPLPNEFIYNI